MPGPWAARLVLTLTLALIAAANQAIAQSGPYVSGSAFADIKRFGHNDIGLGGDDDDSFDATGAGGGIRIGHWLHPLWTLELGVDAGSRTTTRYTYPIQILIFPPPPPLEVENSNSFLSVSTAVGFHPRASSRFRMGYLAGFSFVRGRDAINGVGLPRQPARTTRTETYYTGALILGAEAAIAMTSHLSIVPEVRALVFSAPSNGPGVFLIRPGVAARWTF